MSAKTYIVDSSSTTRRVKNWWAIDSGGVARKAKKVWIIDSSSTARLVFSGADYLTMVVGLVANDVGYVNGTSGSLTPNTLGDGSIVQGLGVGNNSSSTPHQLIFFISNYPGTITASYLTSLFFAGATFAPGDANYTSFSGGNAGGTAQWIWQNSPIPLVGGTITIIVTRT